jgi:hypothetical protein
MFIFLLRSALFFVLLQALPASDICLYAVPERAGSSSLFFAFAPEKFSKKFLKSCNEIPPSFV